MQELITGQPPNGVPNLQAASLPHTTHTLPGEMHTINHDAVPPELINSLGERHNLSSAWREYILTWIQRPMAF
jgi:hypothetical protein